MLVWEFALSASTYSFTLLNTSKRMSLEASKKQNKTNQQKLSLFFPKYLTFYLLGILKRNRGVILFC